MNEHKLYIAIDAEALLGSYAPELYAALAVAEQGRRG